MTMVEVIAIIATGILCVLCVICVVAAISSRSQARANSRAIKDIERSLSSFGDSIKQKTDQLIDHMDRQQIDDLQEQRLEFLEQEVLRLTELGIEAGAAAGAPEVSAEDPQEEPLDVPQMQDESDLPYEIQEIEEIEELDDEIELDDLFRELDAMSKAQPAPPQPQTQQPAPPQPVETKHHQGYNVGRSGKRYTAEELNMLIRE